MIYSIVLIAAVLVGLTSRYFFHGIKSEPTSFWGSECWKRKYKSIDGVLQPRPNTLYYRVFKDVKYKEKFHLSATALVFITDGPHLCQFFAIKLTLLGMVIGMENSIRNFFILLALYHLGFNVAYRK